MVPYLNPVADLAACAVVSAYHCDLVPGICAGCGEGQRRLETAAVAVDDGAVGNAVAVVGVADTGWDCHKDHCG